MTVEELDYIKSSLTEIWISSTDSNIDSFEKSIKNYLDDNTEVTLLNSSTSAIHMALIQLGVKKGDKVIYQVLLFRLLPTLSYILILHLFL